MIAIGIDPDMRASGVAVVYGPENYRKVHSLDNVKLPAIVEFVKSVGVPKDVVVKLENPAANKAVFTRDIAGARDKRAVRDAIAMKVGKVMATTHHIRELLENAGYTVKMVTPLKGPLKRQAKDDAAYFNKVTGWTGRSNQDQRDAALIALWG
jgi:antirestriction protein ArdC